MSEAGIKLSLHEYLTTVLLHKGYSGYFFGGANQFQLHDIDEHSFLVVHYLYLLSQVDTINLGHSGKLFH